MKKKFTLILIFILLFSLTACTGKKNEKLVIGVQSIATHLNPLFYTNSDDELALDLMFTKLFPVDREGNLLLSAGTVEGETSEDGYTYYGAASLTTSLGDESSYIYSIRLLDDLYCADGEELTAKDLIFSLYVLLDPTYSGSVNLSSLPIKGLSDYQNAVNEALQIGNAEDREEALLETYISGINVIGNYVRIEMTRELTADEMNILNIYVAPLHHYGSLSLYSPSNNMFGFIKGDLSSISSKGNTSIGYGPYILSSTGTTLTFSRNNAYYKGAAKIKTIQIKLIYFSSTNGDGEVVTTDFYHSIDEDTIDFARIIVDDYARNEISRYNLNSLMIGNCLSLYTLGGDSIYGYITSTKRFDYSSIENLGLTDYYTYIDAIEYLNVQ
ncbi:MAG: hypothetical protein H6687_03195 [Bacillales bacterium]|nr:hypothetical protein [Bacillales bacterium]